jgi:hypothetical protein
MKRKGKHASGRPRSRWEKDVTKHIIWEKVNWGQALEEETQTESFGCEVIV